MGVEVEIPMICELLPGYFDPSLGPLQFWQMRVEAFISRTLGRQVITHAPGELPHIHLFLAVLGRGELCRKVSVISLTFSLWWGGWIVL